MIYNWVLLLYASRQYQISEDKGSDHKSHCPSSHANHNPRLTNVSDPLGTNQDFCGSVLGFGYFFRAVCKTQKKRTRKDQSFSLEDIIKDVEESQQWTCTGQSIQRSTKFIISPSAPPWSNLQVFISPQFLRPAFLSSHNIFDRQA